MDASHRQPDPHRNSQPPKHFLGLRAKFVILFSVIFIMTCSSLSWYFIETRRQAMSENLEELGTILLTNTIRNEHFRIAGVVLEDRVTLSQFMQSLMAIDQVVYTVITASDGRVLAQQSKLTRHAPRDSSPITEQPVYPDHQLSAALLHTPRTEPLMTKLVVSSTHTLVPEMDVSNWLLLFLLREETIYDFAIPVLRKPSTHAPLSQLSVELEGNASAPLSDAPSPVVALVRIGITDAQAKQALLVIVRNAAILTGLIIAAGIVGALLLTSRITTPLRSLAGAARQLAHGNDTPIPILVSTTDEVGELTQAFNVMTQSLHDRNHAIAANLDTIKRQVRQLTTAHQASEAIANATLLNMDQLLDTVLALFIDNLKFSRMAVFLHHPDRTCASLARSMGISPEVAEIFLRIDIPVVDNDGVTANPLLQGKPVLIRDIESLAPRLSPPILDLARRAGVQSFVAVPLQSHGKILGFLAGDRGLQQCTDEDLHILLTIAGHVAAAIDNAKAYADLAELTQHLEARIEQRTDELSRANTQLQAHDQRRSAFLSVVSHELRTPMTAIGSFADNMLDGVTGPLTDLQHTYLSRIQHNVARLGRIIVQLLDWSRLDTKKVRLHLEDICIHQIATTTADDLRAVATANQVSLVVTAADSLPPVRGDRDKVEQILWNLIGNAIKFTPPGGRVTVECCISPSGFVQTCIADTGCGIDPLDLLRIFDEFSRVPSAMPASQGAQLGLCITKTLVTMHHGEIWVNSTPGRGSRFYFTLPVVGSHNASVQMT